MIITTRISIAVTIWKIYAYWIDSENAIFSLMIGIPKNFTQDDVHSILTMKKNAPPDTMKTNKRMRAKYRYRMKNKVYPIPIGANSSTSHIIPNYLLLITLSQHGQIISSYERSEGNLPTFVAFWWYYANFKSGGHL